MGNGWDRPPIRALRKVDASSDQAGKAGTEEFGVFAAQSRQQEDAERHLCDVQGAQYRVGECCSAGTITGRRSP